MKIPKASPDEIRAEVRSWIGLDLTDAQVETVLSDPRVAEELQKFGLDTETRGAMANYLARTLLGRSWPTYGDKDPTFFDDFEAAAVQKGFKLVK